MSQANQNNPNNNNIIYTKIFVGNLAWNTTIENLRNYFQRFGEVFDANVVRETYPGRSKGYGFVVFRDAASAGRALEDLNPIIDGRRTNRNLAFFGAKNNLNQPNQIGSLNQLRPLHQHQPPSFQHVSPLNAAGSGQYGYMYNMIPNYPCYYYTYPTQMPYYQGIPHMAQQPWQQTLRQTNTQYVVTSVPQRSPAQIPEIIQQVTADVVHDDGENAVTKQDSDVDQQTEKEKILQDSDAKQDSEDYERKISDQEDGIKKDVDEEINSIKKDMENQEVEIVYEQKNCTKEDEDVTEELNDRIEFIILQDKRVLDEALS